MGGTAGVCRRSPQVYRPCPTFLQWAGVDRVVQGMLLGAVRAGARALNRATAEPLLGHRQVSVRTCDTRFLGKQVAKELLWFAGLARCITTLLPV